MAEHRSTPLPAALPDDHMSTVSVCKGCERLPHFMLDHLWRNVRTLGISRHKK
jgi:hypothetical protein